MRQTVRSDPSLCEFHVLFTVYNNSNNSNNGNVQQQQQKEKAEFCPTEQSQVITHTKGGLEQCRGTKKMKRKYNL